MFTGLVEETGMLHGREERGKSARLSVLAKVCGRGVKDGDSVAVNGCCLTVVSRRRAAGGVLLGFDLLRETLDRTGLGALEPGSPVNLERSMAAGGRFGGHFITGHVDGTGRITLWERRGDDHVLEIAVPPALRRLMIEKGSVAVDGISLTVAAPTRAGFRVWIIPHTLAVTNLRSRAVGDHVNIEADLIGKYVQRLVRARR